MKEKAILKVVEEFYNKLPKFPDGRINYSNSNGAVVMTIFVKHKNKILLLKRSDKVLTYKGKWMAVAGYLDELKPIRKKVLEELQEEIGINLNLISSIHIGKIYKFKDKKINKTWIVIPVLVKIKKKPEVRLDWEHTEFKWINEKELKNYDVVPKLDKSLKYVL